MLMAVVDALYRFVYVDIGKCYVNVIMSNILMLSFYKLL